jgi:predicted kinase
MKVYIGIGIPGSGKTTALKALAAQEGLAYVSADDIREELTGDPSDHTKEDEVWATAHERVRQALQGKGVVVDATHAKQEERLSMVSFARKHGAKDIIGYWVSPPLQTATVRNTGRERVVPEHVIHQMHQRLKAKPPRLEEGFTEIRKLV